MRPYLEEVARRRASCGSPFGSAISRARRSTPDCAAAVLSTAKLCEELGHRVEEAEPKFDGQAFGDAFLILWAAVAGRVIKGVKKSSAGT